MRGFFHDKDVYCCQVVMLTKVLTGLVNLGKWWGPQSSLECKNFSPLDQTKKKKKLKKKNLSSGSMYLEERKSFYIQHLSEENEAKFEKQN